MQGHRQEDKSSCLIRDVRAIDPLSGMDCQGDVWIEEGVVREIGEQIEVPETVDVEVVDGRGCVLGPGWVDLYACTGEPGFEERETLDSLQQAALAGGYTRVALLPQMVPPLDTPAGVAQIRDRTRGLSQPRPQLYCWGALTQGTNGQQMTELGDLKAAEVVGFSDGRPLNDGLLLRRILEYAQTLDLPIALYPCDRALMGDGVVREGVDAFRLGLPTIPVAAETAALSSLLECVAEVGTPVHVMRVSTERSLELLAEAKSRGLPVTASIPWTHLVWDTRHLENYDPNFHLDPPLGTPGDRRAAIAAVKSGILDAIATDHAPYAYEEKTVAFSEAPPGTIGLELALTVLWQQLVATGELTETDLWRAASCNPAHCLQQSPPRLERGNVAEAVLFDPRLTWKVDGRSLVSRSDNTPVLGETLTGRVRQVWCPSPQYSRTSD